MRPFSKTVALFALAGAFGGCSTPEPVLTIPRPGPEKINFKAVPFNLEDVQLLPGPYLRAMELDMQSTLAYEPDRLLAKFRKEAGLAPKAEHYHGWEDETISGHTLGHYLSACAHLYKSSGDIRFLEQVRYVVQELAECQDVDGSGYVAAIPNGKRILGEEVASGNIKAQAFYLNGLWAPFYNLHKTMAGLRDAFRLCGNRQALVVEKRLADWIYAMVSRMTAEQVQTMLSCEHGGMNEVLADLHADTGEDRYMELSDKFFHKAVLDPLVKGEDVLSGLHANTQVPKLIGLARRYELSANENERQAAWFFWDRVVYHHSYTTGGHGNHEYFGAPDKLRDRLSDETTETCNVYNMLKLTQRLFMQEATPELADYTERALLNHILSSQHPQDGRVIYNLSLEMGGRKTYQNPLDFTCCIGSGMENHSKYNGDIYYHSENTLFINQFIASELNWREKGVVIRQETSFPEQQKTSLVFRCQKPVDLKLKIRYPKWLKSGQLYIRINGRKIAAPGNPGSYVELFSQWKNGDRVDIDLPFELRLDPMPDDPNRVAICYGPLVLAGDLGPEDVPNPYDREFVPVLKTTERNPARWLAPVEGQPNTFQSRGIGYPRDVTLRPFYQTHNRRYSVYWDIMSEETWKKREEEYLKNQVYKKLLEEKSVDHLVFGDERMETLHQLNGSGSNVGRHQDRSYRQAERGGWFSCRLKTDPESPMMLEAEYWGGFTGSKTFDILVDGQKVATEDISGKAEGRFLQVKYPLPPALTLGKREVEVRFEPHSGHRAGPVFTLWIFKAESN
ncbi:MAG: beta-L-arabinofuranosidase domain-containing protein [Saprospiraceae bacterium]|jgi:DUF1680 family protein